MYFIKVLANTTGLLSTPRMPLWPVLKQSGAGDGSDNNNGVYAIMCYLCPQIHLLDMWP